MVMAKSIKYNGVVELVATTTNIQQISRIELMVMTTCMKDAELVVSKAQNVLAK